LKFLIHQGSDGRWRVSGAARNVILDLRLDPHAASAMAAEFTAQNAAYLRGRTGREPGAGDLYAAHFLGASGAVTGLVGMAMVFGHRHGTAQGIALRPSTGQVWSIEHGARGGDELNLEVAGANYGWPDVTYGIEYNGQTISEGITARDGVVQPDYYWDPSIAPGGMTFYDAALVPAWRGDLFVTALNGKHLARLVLDGDRVVGELSGGGLGDAVAAPADTLYASLNIRFTVEGGVTRYTLSFARDGQFPAMHSGVALELPSMVQRYINELTPSIKTVQEN
jgi:hypothetical protein